MPQDVSTIIPRSAPVMVLGGATLFPHGYMPLFLFEQPYREMLRYALERDRMFCIGHVRPGIDPETHADPVFGISTVGLIRACVTHDDGTSHLMLSGLQRVEIIGWEQISPFRIASILPRESTLGDPCEMAGKALELIDLCGRMCGQGMPMSDQLRDHLRCVREPGAISDVVAQTFLNDPIRRQELLETFSVEARLSLLCEHLSELLAKGNG